jgi:hypothetical protein
VGSRALRGWTGTTPDENYPARFGAIPSNRWADEVFVCERPTDENNQHGSRFFGQKMISPQDSCGETIRTISATTPRRKAGLVVQRGRWEERIAGFRPAD